LKTEMTKKNFASDFSDLLIDYDKEMDKIKKIEAEMKRLESNAKSTKKTSSSGILGGVEIKGTANEEARVRLEMEAIQAEQRKQQLIQKTLILIQDTTYAYLEAGKQMEYLGDSGMKFIERFHQSNEDFLKYSVENGKKVENDIDTIEARGVE